MERMELKLNKSGQLLEPNFHDGLVEAIDVSKGESAELLLSTVEGDRYLLVLSEVRYLRCSEFREGNIIFDLSVFSGTVPPNDLLGALLGTDGEDIHSKRFSASVLKGDLTLVSITPSYGCELQALCSAVELRPI